MFWGKKDKIREYKEHYTDLYGEKGTKLCPKCKSPLEPYVGGGLWCPNCGWPHKKEPYYFPKSEEKVDWYSQRDPYKL